MEPTTINGSQVLPNDKEELFAHEYLIDLNGTQSYLRVFSDVEYNTARREASKLKALPHVRARIRYLMEQRSANILVDAGYVLESLIHIAEKAQQAEEVMVFNYDTKQMEGTGEYKFDSNGANKALELIGRHLGLWQDKLKLETPNALELIITGTKFANENTP